MSEDAVDYAVLGPLAVARHGRRIEPPPPKQRLLLIRLLVARNEVVSPDRLIDAVWGDSAPATARKTLQLYVSKLRRALGDGALETHPAGYLLRVASEGLDSERFEGLLADGRKSLADNPELAAAVLRRALSMWRGPALADATYAAFARSEARRLEELRVECFEELVAADLALGRHAEKVSELEELVAEHPFRERLRAQLMLVYYRLGRQADALAEYHTARKLLREELGLDPSAELRALEAAILRQEVGLDLVAPQARRHHSLPYVPTSLVGRTHELEELSTLLVRPAIRFLSLVGAGGSGKTRLAIALGHSMANVFANGVVFVELAAIREPQFVVPAIAAACGVTEAGDDPLETLARWLAEKELLLVVDNVEHVAAAGEQLAALVARASRLTLLTTSRSVLHLSGEHVYTVSPLPTDDAVALFIARATAADAGFDGSLVVEGLLEQICERLDGLPLAVELAAARTRALTLPALLERLEQRLPVLIGGPRDLPARQQTLRSTLEWSSDLLEKNTRTLFARLAVFPGPFTLDAAEAICSANIDGLEALVDFSLLRRVGERYSMLATIREHAAELQPEPASSRSHIRELHARYFAVLAARIDLKGSETDRWLRALDDDLHNFRAALSTARDLEDDELSLRLATGLYRFWYLRGLFREGCMWLRGPVERAAGTGPLQASAHRALAGLRWLLGDLDEAEVLAERGIRIGLKANALECVMGCHTVLGLVATANGHLERAREHVQQSEALARQLGLEHDVYVALTNLGEIEYTAGNLDTARSIWDEALAWIEDHGVGEPAFVYLGLGALAHAEGRLDDADEHLSAALERAEARRLPDVSALALTRLAAINADRGEHVEATITLGRASSYIALTRGEPSGEEARLYEQTRAATLAALGPKQHAQLLVAGSRGDVPTNH